MSLFNFSMERLLTFFMVLLRYSVLFSVLPFLGDRFIPQQAKILLSLIVSFAIFPALIQTHQIDPNEALVWSQSASRMVGIASCEVILGLVLGFSAKLVFDGISVGANWVGTFMGLATASQYDPHQESQSGVIAQIQTTIAMILFLVLDGHHLMLRAALESYRIVGLGQATFTLDTVKRLVEMTSDVFRFGLQMSAPVAMSLFSVNIIFGILSKAMPQLNVFVLSFAVSLMVGLFSLYLSVPHLEEVFSGFLAKTGDWMWMTLASLRGGK